MNPCASDSASVICKSAKSVVTSPSVFSALNAEPRQPASERPGLKNLEVFDSPEVIFPDHCEERGCDLTAVAQEIDLNDRAMRFQRG